MKIFIVLSRDQPDFIFTTADHDKAEAAKKKQQLDEEMGGGRPSVYIKETELELTDEQLRNELF